MALLARWPRILIRTGKAMKPSILIAAIGGALALASCNSTGRAGPDVAPDTDYKKLGGIHAHHTPEQHAAFLKRVGQLSGDEEAELAGGGGGHHH
jgi:hypothetical protein